MLNQTTLLNELEIRDTDVHSSGGALFGAQGAIQGLIVIENKLNQIVSIQAQGRALGSEVWQNIGAATNVAATVGTTPGAGNIALTVSWPEVQITATCGGAPASGSVTAWLSWG